MRWITTLALLFVCPLANAGEGIVAVLARSQTARLECLAVVDPGSERALRVRTSFNELVHALGFDRPPELRVIDGETVAETLQGRVVVANQSLADLDEGERVFILAHELGHVALRHWEQTEKLYQKWVPGAVAPEQTEPVAALLGRDASGLSYQQELAADAYALGALHALGMPLRNAVTAFMRLGMSHDTATHPGTRKRLGALRAAEAEWQATSEAMSSSALQPTTRNEPIDSLRRPD